MNLEKIMKNPVIGKWALAQLYKLFDGKTTTLSIRKENNTIVFYSFDKDNKLIEKYPK